MPSGKVDFFHDRKGYGFFSTPAADDDVFFHMDDIEGAEPEEGEEFEFEIEEGERGLRATEISRLESKL
jgi:CspA family cold shock protein